jgi:hypothetical protein
MDWLTHSTVRDNSLQAWLTAIGIIVLILVVLAMHRQCQLRPLAPQGLQHHSLRCWPRWPQMNRRP